MFYFEKISGKNILKSDMLKDIEHFFTTRESVIRTNDPRLQNLAAANKYEIRRYLKVRELISPSQTHSANIRFAIPGKRNYPDTDAMILDNDEQAVFLNFADCTPVILYDKKQHTAAIAHAGWRGTEQKIVPKTVAAMNSKPEDIVAVIGPAICMSCFKVGKEVFNLLKATVEDFEGLYRWKNSEYFVDLKGLNVRQLNEIGVTEIDICPYCTCCDNDMFFSYRKENATTSRPSAVIRL